MPSMGRIGVGGMNVKTVIRAGAAAAMALLCGQAAAQTTFSAQRIASGLTRPVFVTAPPGDFNRLFIVEQRGSGGVGNRAYIKILNLSNNTINALPFLAITGVATGGEQGLLGLAFDPNYATNGRFYVNYTAADWTTHVVRYTVSAGNPNQADALSATTVFTQPQPFDNHNGGWLAFGPDNFLYVALGDGGSGGDPQNNAQSLNTILGKIVRIDVSSLPYTIPPTNPFFGSTSARQEIWAYGLRNPWRNSFDRATGQLYIADVGQEVWEEINVQPAATTGPARNYGWRCYEGNNPFITGGCAPMGTMTFPVHTYQHTAAGGECSVTGGYVYRGCKIPDLRGTYFFADWCANRISSLRYENGTVSQVTNRTAQLTPVGGPAPAGIVSFGEDAAGEMYFMGSGNLFKIVPVCSANCDGSSAPPVLNVLDFNCFLNRFAAQDCAANCDNSTAPPVLNVLDFNCFLNSFSAGCP